MQSSQSHGPRGTGSFDHIEPAGVVPSVTYVPLNQLC
jgi:hypothetical protein